MQGESTDERKLREQGYIRIDRFCYAMDRWAQVCQRELSTDDEHRRRWRREFSEHWQFIRLAIAKSCLLDRLIYGGERLCKEMCPTHPGAVERLQYLGGEALRVPARRVHYRLVTQPRRPKVARIIQGDITEQFIERRPGLDGKWVCLGMMRGARLGRHAVSFGCVSFIDFSSRFTNHISVYLSGIRAD